MYSMANRYMYLVEANTSKPLSISGKKHSILVGLSSDRLEELLDILENNKELELFTCGARIVSKQDPKKSLKEINLAIAIADSNDKTANFPSVTNIDLSNTVTLHVYPKQLANLEYIKTEPLYTQTELKKGDPKTSIGVIFTTWNQPGVKPPKIKEPEEKVEPKSTPAPKPEPEVKKEPTEDVSLEKEMKTIVGANPKKKTKMKSNKSEEKYRLKSFDDFIKEEKETTATVDIHTEVEKADSETKENEAKIKNLKKEKLKKESPCLDCDDEDSIA